jgi:hypothetical protein
VKIQRKLEGVGNLLENYYCVDGEVLGEIMSDTHCGEVVPSREQTPTTQWSVINKT